MPPTDELSDLLESQPGSTGRDRRGRYLDDDGFTARTLQRLPPPRRRWRGRVLGTALLLSLLIDTVMASDMVAKLGQLWRATAGAASASAQGVVPLTALAVAVVLTAALVFLRDERS
jgi:hypothetical protein